MGSLSTPGRTAMRCDYVKAGEIKNAEATQ
jgi:hypothetical protein